MNTALYPLTFELVGTGVYSPLLLSWNTSIITEAPQAADGSFSSAFSSAFDVVT